MRKHLRLLLLIVCFLPYLLLSLAESFERLGIVDLEDSWNDGYEDGLIFVVDIDGIVFFPPVVADAAGATDEVDEIFIDISEWKLSQQNFYIFFENIMILEYLSSFAIKSPFFLFKIPLSFEFIESD